MDGWAKDRLTNLCGKDAPWTDTANAVAASVGLARPRLGKGMPLPKLVVLDDVADEGRVDQPLFLG